MLHVLWDKGQSCIMRNAHGKTRAAC